MTQAVLGGDRARRVSARRG